MADLTKTVEIIFGAVDDTGKGLSSISNRIEGAVDNISGVTEPLSNLADNILKADAAVAVLAAGFVAMSANEASKFGEKMEEIGSLINATPEKVASLGTSIQQFALNSTSDFDKISQAVYIATSNLGDTGKAMDILGVAEKGAVVGATDLEASTALLTRTMNAYGLVTDDSATNTANAERVMAAMFTTVQNGDINLSMLSDNLGKVASSAAAAGVPIETIGAAIAAITGAGVNAEQSMTLLNALLKELLSPSDELSKALGGLKVTSDGLPAVMDRLKDSTGGSAEKIYELFGSSEAAKGALILANDSAGKFHITLGAMKDGVANLNKNFKDFAGGMADSMQNLENAWRSMMITVGKPNTENFQAIYDALSSVLTAVETAMRQGAFDELYKFIDDFSDKFSETLGNIAKNLPDALNQVDLRGLVEAIKELGGEIGSLFVGIDLNTPKGLAEAIQKVVDTAETMIKVSKGIVESWKPTIEMFKNWIDSLNRQGDAAKAAEGSALGYAQQFEKLKGLITGAADALNLLSVAMTSIAGVQVTNAIAGASTSIAALSAASGTAGAALAGSAGLASAALVASGAVGYGVGTGLSAGIDALVSKLTGSETSLGSWIYDITHSAESAKKAAGEVDNLGSTIDVFKNKLGSLSNDQLATVLANVSKASGVTVRSIEELATAFYNSKISADQIAAATESLGKNLSDVGEKAKESIYPFEKLADAMAAQEAALANGEKAWIDYKDGIYQVHAVAKGVADDSKDMVQVTGEVSTATAKASQSFKTLAEAQAYMNTHGAKGVALMVEEKDGLFYVTDKALGLASAKKKLGNATEDASKAAIKGSQEWKTVQEILLATQKQTNDFTISMGELANKRYEIDVRAAVDLQTAEIEAETSRISKAFDSMDHSIEVFSGRATDLWGIFGEKAGFTGAEEIKNAALNMERRLDDELAIKKQYTDAIVERLRAETVRLTSGEPLISIDARELAPELELVFDKILKYTQVKATQQGLAMLVGL